MKHNKEQFIELLLKRSYHAHALELSQKDQDYLDMLLVRDNMKYLYYDEEDTKTEEDN